MPSLPRYLALGRESGKSNAVCHTLKRSGIHALRGYVLAGRRSAAGFGYVGPLPNLTAYSLPLTAVFESSSGCTSGSRPDIGRHPETYGVRRSTAELVVWQLVRHGLPYQ